MLERMTESGWRVKIGDEAHYDIRVNFNIRILSKAP